MKTNLPKPLNNKNVIFTLYGRNGLYVALKSIGRNGTILVPSYSCGDEIQAIIAAGYDIQTYPVRASLQAAISDIRKNFTKKTFGILITHYFGFPQKHILQLKKLCESRGILLIEDCAHCIQTSIYNRPLGTFGDIAIFSIRKHLTLSNGGALLINNQKLFRKSLYFQDSPQKAILFDQRIYKNIQSGIFLPGTSIYEIYQKLGEKIKLFGPRLERFGGYNLKMPPYTLQRMVKVNIKKIIKDKKRVYQKLTSFFINNRKLRVEPIFKKYSNVITPLFFPVLVKRDADVNKIISYLQRNKIFSVRLFWDHVHPLLRTKKYADTDILRKRLLILPVDKKLVNKRFFAIINNAFK